MLRPLSSVIALALCACLIVAAPAAATGLQGSSVLALDGDDAYATGPDGPAYDLGTGTTDDFTIETRFHISGVTAQQTGILFLKDSAYRIRIQFNADVDKDRILFQLYKNDSSGMYVETPRYDVGLSDGWHHLAVVFDNENTETSDLFTLYLDGALVANSLDHTAYEWTPGLPDTSGAFYLGGNAATFPNSFPGRLEETRVSDTVRYSGASYDVPTVPFTADDHTVALWHFNETPSSTVFADSSGNGNDLIGYLGAATYNDDMAPPTAPLLGQPLTPTNKSAVPLTGTAEALSTVLLYDGGDLLGSTTASLIGSFTYAASLSQGHHALTARARDTAGNTSDASATRNVTVDLTRPVPRALANVGVRRTRTAKLRYRVNDTYSPKAKKVTIRIFRRSRCVKTITLRDKPTNTSLIYKYRCRLRRGTYTWKVYATDLAGNTQAKPSVKRLYVR